MLKINQSSIFVSPKKNLIEITNTNNNSECKEVKQYRRSKYIPDSDCVLSLLSNPKNDFIDGSCINIIKLDSLYLNSNLTSKVYDIELHIDTNTFCKNAKSISPNKKYFAVISEAGALSIYDLPSSIKCKYPVKVEIEYNNNNKVILFKKLEVYNKNILEFSADSKHLLILSDDYVNILSKVEDNKWSLRVQFDRTEKSTGNHCSHSYLGSAAFCFQDNTLNIALERKNIQNNPMKFNDLPESIALEASNQYFHKKKNNQLITSTIQLYTCQLNNQHRLTELIKKDSIPLLAQPQDMLLSYKCDLLIARLADKIHILSKIKNNWTLTKLINITDNYIGKIAPYKFNFNNSVRMRFNDYQDKIIIKIGNDKVIVYSRLDNNNWELYNINKTSRAKINFHDIDKIAINNAGSYIVICDSKGCIALLKENNKEYRFVKDISPDKLLFGINSLSFSKDGNKIIAISNKGIKIFMPF